jgi:hypothetical protein
MKTFFTNKKEFVNNFINNDRLFFLSYIFDIFVNKLLLEIYESFFLL